MTTTILRTLALVVALGVGCSPDPQSVPVIELDADPTGADASDGADTTTSEDVPVVTAPVFPEGTTFIDTHMHCGAIDPDEPGRCLVGEPWAAAAPEGAAGVILSIEHWTMSLTDETRAELEAAGGALASPDELNEIYAATAQERPELAFFVSLECWHDTPYGDGWAEACKEDARRWVVAGAHGFKDHVGKQWQSENDGADVADAGIFAGAWSRNAGRCADVASNRACVQSEEVLYPLLTDEWREVVRYIVEDLKAPIISHATTWYGAEAECFDPLAEELAQCAPMSRRHLVEFAQWAEQTLDDEARRRFVVGHGGFMIPGEKLLPRDDDPPEIAAERERIAQEMLTQLDQVLQAGLSIEAATLKDFVSLTYRPDGACILRDLFARYPDRWMLGTDRSLDNGECIAATYALWRDVLTLGIGERGPSRPACFGATSTFGIALDQTSVADCPREVPVDVVERFLTENFLALYD